MAVVGLCQIKINGVYEVPGKTARWDVRQPVAEHATGGGNEQATGMPTASGSIEETIPANGGTVWKNLKNFSVEIVDELTKKTVFLGEKCNWETAGGATDRATANTTKSIGFKCARPVTW